MNRKTGWLGILLFLAVASCGGDGPGLADLRNGPITETPEEEQPVELGSVELLTSSPQMLSDGSTIVTLTAFAKNANNQAVAGIPITFSADSGTLVVVEGSTSDQGIATAELATTGDPTNRSITVTATAPDAVAGTLSDTVNVAVIGTTLQMQGPGSLVLEDPVTYTITLANSAGIGIASQAVQVASEQNNALSSTTLTTDANGTVQVDLTANTDGDDTLTASALPDADGNPTVTASLDINVSSEDFRFTAPESDDEIELNTPATISIEWKDENGTPVNGEAINFATTRGDIINATPTDASGVATAEIRSDTAGPATITATTEEVTAQLKVEFVATDADQLIVQVDPSIIGPTETSTITAIVEDPAGNRVKNKTVTFTLSDTTQGTLSVPFAVTDSLGRAKTTYTATTATSAEDGVVVTARVTGTPLEEEAHLTVAGRALFITFGTGNTIVEDEADTTYTKDYTLFVTDASGSGVADATVNLRMLSIGFVKGELTEGTELWKQTATATCPGEDLNNNGTLDTSEDINGDGELSPGNVATVNPGSVTTDENGSAVFHITYPQNFAFWVIGRIAATTTVAGSESRKSENFYFPASADDLALDGSPPNGTSPWGVSANCTDVL